MPWPDTQFSLADLWVGDQIQAEGDDFDARLTVIREDTTPGCTMQAPDVGPILVQLIGHGIYEHDIVDHSTFVTIGAVGGGGQLIYVDYETNHPRPRANSLTRWKVWRNGELIYNRGETPDETGDPEVPADPTN